MPRARLASLCLAALSLASTARADPIDDVITARCAREPRLLGAAELALRDPRGFDAVALRERAESSGLPAPAVHAFVAEGDAAALADALGPWLARHAASPSLSRCALAFDGDRVAVAVAPRAVVPAASPRDPARPARRAWQVAWPAGVTDAALVVTAPSGEVTRRPLDAEGRVEAELAGAGSWTLQLIATLATGPAPFATWHEVVEGASTEAPAVPLWSARELLAAINALRARSGVAALRRDPLLDAVAARHAERLAEDGALAHAPRADDDPVARLRRAHVASARVAENIARAQDLTAAHARLAASPSHRANLVDAQVDAVGLGFARARGVIYLVEMFASRPALNRSENSGSENSGSEDARAGSDGGG